MKTMIVKTLICCYLGLFIYCAMAICVFRCRNQEKILSVVRRLILTAALLYVVCSIVSFFYNYRIVATAEGNNIYYDNATYAESFEVIDIDLDKDRCLGSVKFSEGGRRCKIYSYREKPGYIYVDVFLDFRLYVRVSDK